MREPTNDKAECGGPKYDRPGVLGAKCIACGKCDAVQRLMRELIPAAANETTRIAQATR